MSDKNDLITRKDAASAAAFTLSKTDSDYVKMNIGLIPAAGTLAELDQLRAFASLIKAELKTNKFDIWNESPEFADLLYRSLCILGYIDPDEWRAEHDDYN